MAPVASDVSTAVSVMWKGRCSHYRQSFSNDEHIMGIVKAQQQLSIVIQHLKFFFFLNVFSAPVGNKVQVHIAWWQYSGRDH